MSVGAWLDGREREAYKALLREADSETFAGLDFGFEPDFFTSAERAEADEALAEFDRMEEAA